LPLGKCFQHPLLAREAFFVYISLPCNELRKFKCHSGRESLFLRDPI